MLQGAEHCLATHRPGLLLEVTDHLERHGQGVNALHAFLAARDYRPFIRDGAGRWAATGARTGDLLFWPAEAAPPGAR